MTIELFYSYFQFSDNPRPNLQIIYLFLYKFIYFWLHWVFVATRVFSSCSKWGLLFIAVCRLLTAVASLVAEHGLQVCGLQ